MESLTSYVKTVLTTCRFSPSGRLDVRSAPVFQPEMIITKSGVIRQATADVARESLEEQVNKKRSEGVLQPGQRTLEKLEWTPQTVLAAHEFKSVKAY